MKNFTDNAVSTALGVSIAVGAAVGLFVIANRFFGWFNYAELSPTQVDKVALKFQNHTVTKAEGPGYSRGVVNAGGSFYYFKHVYGKSFDIFPMIYERYSTDKDLLGAPVLVMPV